MLIKLPAAFAPETVSPMGFAANTATLSPVMVIDLPVVKLIAALRGLRIVFVAIAVILVETHGPQLQAGKFAELRRTLYDVA